MSDIIEVMAAGLTPVYRRGLYRLELGYGATADDGTTTVMPYDFADYTLRYGLEPPSPRYLLIPLDDADEPGMVRVWLRRDPAAAEEEAQVTVPAGWPAGHSLVVPLSGAAADVTDQLRLTRLQPPPGSGPDRWRLVVLLGNLAKLLWTVGAGYEELRRHAGDVADQRSAERAHGASLDLHGRDLGVPRFPATPHSVDTDTLALYHFDDQPVPPNAAVVEVTDDRSRYGLAGRAGTNNGGHSGQPGRLGTAFRFRENQTSVEVPHDAALAPAAGASFTVEALIKPEGTGTGAIVAKKLPLNTRTGPGWALTVGTFRGYEHNVRFSLCGGAAEVDLFADRDLGDGAFHHVAGVIDVQADRATALLYVDGEPTVRRLLDPAGSYANTEPVRIGYGREDVDGTLADAQYVGLIDEVRLSSVARTSFHPVVGEGDAAYRRRLRLFQRWQVPTPDAIQAALNDLAGPVGGDAEPFVVDETVDPLVAGTCPIRVLPAPLPPGQAIDAAGTTSSVAAFGGVQPAAAAAVGPAADGDFDPAWLCRHSDRPRLDFAGNEDNRRMQVSVRDRLDRLLTRLTGVTGVLAVLRAYDPAATDLHGVGRALRLGHDTLEPGKLAVQAHAAGFAWVCCTGSGDVAVAEPRVDVLHVIPAAPDVVEGGTLTLGVDPDLSGVADARLRWSVVRCGAGAAAVAPGATAADPVTLYALAAGDVSVHVEATRRRHTGSGSRTIRIGLSDTGLAPGESIAGDGRRGATLSSAVDGPDPGFSELYLRTRTDDRPGLHPHVSYGTDPANRRMQPVAGAALDRLLDMLAGIPGTLSVVKAYDQADVGLLGQGRALWLRHSSMSASALAARAFAARFDHIRIDAAPPQTVQVASAAGEHIEVMGADEVQVGRSATVAVQPQAEPRAVCLSDDGARAYVACRGSHRVTALSLTAAAPGAEPAVSLERSVPVPPLPAALAFAPGQVFVTSEHTGVVTVLHPVTLATTATMPTGPAPVALAVAGNRLLVGCAGDATVRAYDRATGQAQGSLTLPAVPRVLARVPGAPALYALLDGDRFARVDTAALALAGPVVTTAAGARHLVVGPDGAKLYVACSGEVSVYDTTTNAQTAAVTGYPADTAPRTLAVDAAHVYVATTVAAGAGRVHVLDPATDTLLPQVFTPGVTCDAMIGTPAGAPYLPGLVAVSADGAALVVGDPAPLAAAPPRPPRTVTIVPLGSGVGERLAWSTVSAGPRLELASQVRPTTAVQGVRPGPALVRAVYLRGAYRSPYQFEAALKPGLAADRAARLTKQQYDLVMNVLNALHPLGVEVRTPGLRAHVTELAVGQAELFPGYTYPIYHDPAYRTPARAYPAEEG